MVQKTINWILAAMWFTILLQYFLSFYADCCKSYSTLNQLKIKVNLFQIFLAISTTDKCDEKIK